MRTASLGFVSILVVIFLVVAIGALGFAAWQVSKPRGGQTGSQSSAVHTVSGLTTSGPACPAGTAIFTHSPIDTNKIASIEPLGHMYGEHILPIEADHIYFYTSLSGPDATAPEASVYAPADVTLVRVTHQQGQNGTGIAGSNDYMLEFSACRDVQFFYIHIVTLNSDIQNALKSISPSCGAGTIDQNCTYDNVSLKLKGGELLGTARGFDMGATDTRTKPLGFINQTMQLGSTTASYLHTICPLDYFVPDLKAQFYAKLSVKNPGANGIPACGSVMQDKSGTAQGDWFESGLASQNGINEAKFLALGHDNLDPTQAVISAGSDLLPGSDLGDQIFYQPKPIGYVNRDPSDIRPDGHVYCIEGSTAVSQTQSHVDLQLTDTKTLKADYVTGPCGTALTLDTHPLTYSR